MVNQQQTTDKPGTAVETSAQIQIKERLAVRFQEVVKTRSCPGIVCYSRAGSDLLRWRHFHRGALQTACKLGQKKSTALITDKLTGVCVTIHESF